MFVSSPQCVILFMVEGAQCLILYHFQSPSKSKPENVSGLRSPRPRFESETVFRE
jgi:hypothetical protein